MKKIQLPSFAVMAATLPTIAQTVVTDADLVAGGTYNWTADTEYILDGFVFLEDGGILNIEAGTVIKGKETPSTGDLASTLIIAQGAKIQATGTADQPIIFTSELDDLGVANDLTFNDRGLWGGLIVLGKASIGNSTATAAIEGIPTEDPRGTYGGNNDTDNSGTLQYISIRHGGAEIGAGNEINGPTLGAVGSGTVIEHIEVYSNLDDGIEWFGGTINCKWMVAGFCGDDSFDWDQGFRGKGQFWFAIMDAATGDNGGEFDGATPDGATPFSNPTVYNATWIGSGVGATAENATATLFRDATAGTFANCIFTEFAAHAIEVEDLPLASGVDSRQRLEDGDLNLLNNLYFDFGTGDEFVAGELIRITTDAEDLAGTFLINHLNTNENVIANPELSSVSRITDGNLDPRPSATGAAYTGTMATIPADAFYSDVDYKGAFSADETLWINGWTALSANNHITLEVNIDNVELINSLDLYPNPVNDFATLQFTLEQSANLNINITDVNGKMVEMTNAFFAAGTNNWTINTSNLTAGMYIIQMNNESGKVASVSFIK